MATEKTDSAGKPMVIGPEMHIESEITLVGQGSRLKGEFVFDRFTRIHGDVEGKIHGLPESLIVVGETASIHGEIKCVEIIIDGFVRANVHATDKVTISESGTLIGDVYSPKLEVRFGAHFEGKATTTPGRDTTRPSAETRLRPSSRA